MTTNSEAHFARRLLATLKEYHPDFPVETVKGRRVGAGSMRVIHITHSGAICPVPFPFEGDAFRGGSPTAHREAETAKAHRG